MTYKEATFKCAYCGKVYKTSNYNKGAANHFCSNSCRIKYNSEVKPFRGLSSKIPNCTCAFCGKKFHKTPSTIRNLNFCSRKCQNTFLAHKLRDSAQKDLNCTCLHCGRKFHRKKSHVGEVQFCSADCLKSYRESKRKEKEYEATCPICGKKFVAGIKRDKFCSLECQIAWQRRFYKEVKCSYCGKSIVLDKTRQQNSKSGLFFCSNKCIGKYFRGDRSPAYKGSRTILGILRSYYMRYQRGRAFQRYAKTCQICGKPAEHVHHIYPLHKIVEDYNKGQTIPSDTAERYKIAYNIIKQNKAFTDENNLIALCKDCHKKQHREGITTVNISNIDYGMSDNSYSIFVSGCNASPKCEGCFNPENWDFQVGKNWLNYIERINKDFADFKPLINKIIIVGGEPLDQDLVSLEQLIVFLTKFEIPIYLFTRHPLDAVPQFVKKYCDFIKCGAYIPSLKCDDNYQYGIKLATANQKIYKKGEDY